MDDVDAAALVYMSVFVVLARARGSAHHQPRRTIARFAHTHKRARLRVPSVASSLYRVVVAFEALRIA